MQAGMETGLQLTVQSGAAPAAARRCQALALRTARMVHALHNVQQLVAEGLFLSQAERCGGTGAALQLAATSPFISRAALLL
jgi:hypothetical protein